MKISSIFLSLLTVCMFVACNSDDADSGSATDAGGGADVALTVTAREANTTGIATRAFDDANATDGEMMKNYVIVAVDQSTGKITHILQSGTIDDKEKDTYTDKVHFDTGTYTFYTFANLTLDQLGLSTAKVGDRAPAFDNATLAVDGNQTSVSAFSTGIPMSYKQTVSINAHTAEVNLYVMRMVAKLTLRLTNATSQPMTLNSVTLSDITKNASKVPSADGTTPVPNLYLLPTTATDANGKEYASPRLATAFAAIPSNTSTYSSYSLYSDYTITPATALSIPANNSDKPTELTFYINESQAHNLANFELTLNLTTTQADGTMAKTANRYAILNWTQIARNDYRVIPITLDDYKLTFDVQYFTAIGVLPPTVTDDGTTLNLGFSYYGEIHLVPKLSTWSGREVPDDVSKSLSFADSPWTLVSGSNPEGFFATEPYWNSTKNWIEASIGFTAGTSAVYRLQCTITKQVTNADGTKTSATETLSRNVRFKMTPIDLGAKAGTRSASTDGSTSTIGWHWITAGESLNHNK
ncbi:MAG: hypothetical protein SPE56_11485 [Prevotella sp.]|nr:hypothetical protein [Prevotella sp.]